MFILIKRDLKEYFTSPITYLIGALFVLLLSLFYYQLLQGYAVLVQKTDLIQGASTDLLLGLNLNFYAQVNMLFFFFIPVLGLRAIGDKSLEGPMTLLFRSPLTKTEIVGAKWVFQIIQIFFFFGLLLFFLGPLYFFDLLLFKSSLNGLTALFMNAFVYASVALFCGFIWRNWVMSLICTYALLVFFLLFHSFSGYTENLALIELIQFIGMNTHFEGLLAGDWHLGHFTYYASLLFCLFLFTDIFLERKQA